MANRTYNQMFPEGLGRLISNLIQLEFTIRIALHLQEPHPMPTETLRLLSPGDDLPENNITNWDTLGQLISKYNAVEAVRGGKTIDPEIVDLRDTLAHGRMTASTTTSEYRLIRFSKPDKTTRRAKVEDVHTLTLPWLNHQIGRTVKAMEITLARVKELRPSVRLHSS